MPGPWQHNIPQSLQRGFRIRVGTKKTSKVWLYEKGCAPILEFVKKIAAADNFYSTPSLDGSKTLDDHLTEYERTSFDSALQYLKHSGPGAAVDAARAAEVVAHLTIRSDHFRRTFGEASQKLFADAIDVFCDETNARPLLGLDEKSPPEKFTRAVDEFISEHPEVRSIPLPTHVLHRIAHTVAREGFNRYFLDSAPLMLAMFTTMIERAPSFVREGHNKALTSSFGPSPRMELLRQFIWTVRTAGPGGFILPDCLAVGLEGNGDIQPLMMADIAPCSVILMPVSSHKMLVGIRSAEDKLNLDDFNRLASVCSHQFFIAGSSEFAHLAANIGMASARFMRDAVGTVIKEFKKGPEVPVVDDQVKNKTDSNDNESTNALNVHPPQYTIQFRDCADQGTANCIATAIFSLTSELCRSMPLNRLDGITFAYDYLAALRELDRGFVAAPLVPTNEEFATGMSMAPGVIRNGVRKTHIVMRGEIGHWLIGDDEPNRRLALHSLVQQLAHTACSQMLDERLPDAKIEDQFETFLYEYADSAWRDYFSSRASSYLNPDIGDGYCEIVAAVIRRAHRDLVAARLEYRLSNDMNKLMSVALSRVHDILRFSATVLGHYDGLGISLLEKQPALDAVLKSVGLRDWIIFFDSELSELWSRRGEWFSFDEFLVLNRHAERLLWQHGLFAWKMDDGRIWINVRLVTDADRLLASA